MKTAKLGTIFLVAVMALAGVGASYAHWYDGVYVSVTADMAWFGIGFVDQATNDPKSEWNQHLEDTNYDPVGNQGSYQSHNDPDQPEGSPRVCGEDLPPHPTRPKDYAYTECELSRPRFWHDGTEMYHLDDRCYEIIEVTLGNVYPNYAPNLYFDIANAGTLAADIVGHWMIGGIPGIDPEDETTWFFMEKCTMYPFDMDGDGLDDIEIGFFMDPDYIPPNPDQPQQIDPCQTITFGLSFHILQPYPECTTTTFEFKLRALNYNHEVCDLDDPT
jgi:hypothetical protein